MPSLTKTQLLGGAFQDSEGNVLASGVLVFKLNQDSEVSGIQICSGIEVTVQLDSNGNVASSSSTPTAPNQYIWANDILSPVNSFYRVTGYKSNGQPAWGPNNQQVVSGGVGGGTFNTGLWVPNQVFSWVPSSQPLTLEVNGTKNGSQSLLNLVAGPNITLTDDGVGDVTVSGANSIASPERSHFSLMQAQSSPAGAASGPLMTNDALTTSDSGANNVSSNPPTSTSGSSQTYSVVGGGFGHILRVYQGQFWAYPGRKTIIRGTIRFNFDISAAAGEHYIGASDTSGGASPITGGMLAIGVEKVTLASVGNWILFVSNAGSVTRVDTGVAITADQRYKFEITMASGAVTISINGVLCGTTSSNLPTSPLGLNWYLHGSAGGSGGTCFGTVEYLYVENTTP